MPKQPERSLRSPAVLAEQTLKPRSPVGRDTPHNESIYSGWERALRPKLLQEQAGRLGLGWSQDSLALRRLVHDGQVSVSDAAAFMREKYPTQSLASDQYADLLADEPDRNLIDIQSRPEGDPSRREFEVRSRARTAALGTQGRSDFLNDRDGAPASRNVYMPHLGQVYDQREVTRAIKAVADQLSRQVAGVERGNVQFPINSVDGGSIRPGSITPDKVDQESFNKMVRDMPGPEETVKLRVARQIDVDNDATTTADSGARRIWSVTDAIYPDGYTPRPGPMRVRVVNKGMQFNVMSIDGRAQSIEMRYGLVLKNIPHFLGRVPDQILYATFVGYPPVQVEAVHHEAGPGSIGPDSVTYFDTTRLYDSTGVAAGRAYDDFVTNPPGWLVEHGSSSYLAPSVADVAKCEGVKFMMITGANAKEVYAQLNSKQVNGAYLGGNAQGPTASLPPGRLMESPAPACGSVQITTTTDLDGRRRSVTTATQEWRIAYPFSYEVCAQLVATDMHFSLVVMPDVRHEDAGISGVSLDIDDMSTNGVTVVENNDREIGVDIVVV